MRRNGLPAFDGNQVSSEEDDIEDGEDSDELESDDPTVNATPSSRRAGKAKATGEDQPANIIVQTAFDAYFTYNKPGRVQTSSNVFSELVLPLSAEEYADAINTAGKGPQLGVPTIMTDENRENLFSRFMCELQEGFNLLFYGLGSKRRLLNRFATERCSKRGHVVVVNGFQPEASLKEMLNSIESIPAIQALDLASTAVDKQARRINDFFLTSKIHLYLFVHNIESPPFRSAKVKSILATLAHNPNIHIVASIDNINSPLLWSTSEVFSRKPVSGNTSASSSTNSVPSRGFAWIWHDLTTLASYDFELAFADRSSLSGAHTSGARRKADTLAAQSATAMSETAASHILASVTQKAQKLFTLLGNKQLEAIEAGTEDSTSADAGAGANANLQQFGMGYDVLFNAARDNFIATNDTALRALLGEFRDHSLIVSAQATTGGGGEVLWIPLRKERLTNVLKSLNQG